MGKEVVYEYASDVRLQQLPSGKDKNISTLRITFGSEDASFDASFMGRVRMVACQSCIEKGAEFDRIAVDSMVKRRDFVGKPFTANVVPLSLNEWNFRTQLMSKNVSQK
jgi:hypothetical protein